MSSFSKNVLPRRAHRERLQPGRRVARHGLLEKKKDYKLRARDASRKKRRVKLLKEKAAFRNPDEFYHAMEKGRTDAGVARRTRDGDGGHHVADGEVRRLVETQDRGYVRVKMARERARIEKGKAGLHFLEAAAADGRRRHTVFVGGGGGDSDGDSDGGGGGDGGGVAGFVRERHFARERRRLAGPRAAGAEEAGGGAEEEGVVARPAGREAKRLRKRAGKKGYAELGRRVERVAKLGTAMEDLVLRKNLLGKGARRKVSPGDPQAGVLPVFKWKKVRQR